MTILSQIIKNRPLLALICAPLLAGALNAANVTLPSNAESIEQSGRVGSISLPIGQFGLVEKPTQNVTGTISRQAWRIAGTDNALDLGAALTAQLLRDGYKLQWQCASRDCGGFDFRYNIETSPPPYFQVNIEDFYYFDLRNAQGDVETLLTSNVNGDTYVQKISVKSVEVTPDLEIAAQVAEPAVVTDNVKDDETRVVLTSVKFVSGASTPSEYDQLQLGQIADRLKREAELKVYIVGHSDQSGSLAGNLSITRARASAVRQILINEFGAPATRIFSDGVAFLAPIADNSTLTGQGLNRRVEAVFLTN